MSTGAMEIIIIEVATIDIKTVFMANVAMKIAGFEVFVVLEVFVVFEVFTVLVVFVTLAMTAIRQLLWHLLPWKQSPERFLRDSYQWQYHV